METQNVKRFFLSLILAAAALPALANEGAAIHGPEGGWPHAGLFGTYDRPALQRGLEVYRQVCATCHSLNLVSYRQLEGIGLSEDKIKVLAAEVKVTDGPNEAGDMFERDGRPSDRFKPPFPNEQAARVANGGALPPDLSLMIKARHGGEDYVYSVLTGYHEAPEGVKLADGMNYNVAFPGNQIAMPNPLSADDLVTYGDGTKATRAQMAKDVVQFMAWAAEPHMDVRKRFGLRAIIFLLVMAGVFYAAKRQLWRKLH